MTPEPYAALALQMRCDAINGVASEADARQHHAQPVVVRVRDQPHELAPAALARRHGAVATAAAAAAEISHAQRLARGPVAPVCLQECNEAISASCFSF